MSTKINFEHEAQQKEETYKIGDCLIVDGLLAMIVGIASECLLVALEDGNWFNNPVKVKDRHAITAKELRQMTIRQIGPRVSVEITTKPYKP